MLLFIMAAIAFNAGSNHCAASPIDNTFSKKSQRNFDSHLSFSRRTQKASYMLEKKRSDVYSSRSVEGNDIAFQFSPTRGKRTAATKSPVKSFQLQLAAAGNNTPDPLKTDTNNESLRHAIENLVSVINEPPSPPPSTAANKNNRSSMVHIIGTGLTPTLLNLPLSTLHILSQADAVLYDSLGLSYRDICQIVPKHCEVICVGKRGDKKSWKQKDIDELILKMATEPLLPSSSDVPNSQQQQQQQQHTSNVKSIVRLKGGDPFLFGRTRTEIEALRSNNIPYSYTPGISSCIAGPHLGGIPLTDPMLNCQSFGVWSGTDAFGKSWGLTKDEDEDDARGGKKWRGLDVDVLVFLMIGRLDKLEALCQSIAMNGDGLDGDDVSQKWNKDTPCAVIQNAGGRRDEAGGHSTAPSPVQRVWRSTLGSLVREIKNEDETRTSVSPAVFVVGATAALDLLSQDDSG